MFETLKKAFKIKEIRVKIWITLGFLLLYRLGCYIPVPGIQIENFSSSIQSNNFLNIMSAITGGSLSQGTLFAMGIGPYINASIIVQLLTVGIPKLERLSKEGESGRKKIGQLTRVVAIILAVIQALGILVNSAQSGGINFSYMGNDNKWLTYLYMVILYTAGSCLTIWIGERITEYGVGNGISLLIFVGIISTAGNALLGQFKLIGTNNDAIWNLLAFLIVVIVIFGCIVFVDNAERRIPVDYAKQVKGRKMYGGQSTNIPIKVNASGVMPLIFAFAIISFPELIMSLFWPDSKAYSWWSTYMGSASWVYPGVLALLILFFAFFYAQIQFNPEDVSKNIQQYGGTIRGIRPGAPTVSYLKKISNRITLFGAIFLALIALIPSYIFTAINSASLLNAFSTTGLLIVVSVALEFDKQLETMIVMRSSKGFLK